MGFGVDDFTTTLTGIQLAPPGFLAVERLMVRMPTASYAGCAAGAALCADIASMFLMPLGRAPLCHSCAASRSPWVSSRSTIGCSITRPRSSNTPATWLLTLVAFAAGRPLERSGCECGHGGCVWDFGMVGVWFSHPLAFVLAAGGTLFDRGGGRAEAMEAGVRLCSHQRCLGWQLLDLLQGLVPDPQQGSIPLGLVGLRLLAAASALDCRASGVISGSWSTCSTLLRVC